MPSGQPFKGGAVKYVGASFLTYRGNADPPAPIENFGEKGRKKDGKTRRQVA